MLADESVKDMYCTVPRSYWVEFFSVCVWCPWESDIHIYTDIVCLNYYQFTALHSTVVLFFSIKGGGRTYGLPHISNLQRKSKSSPVKDPQSRKMLQTLFGLYFQTFWGSWTRGGAVSPYFRIYLNGKVSNLLLQVGALSAKLDKSNSFFCTRIYPTVPILFSSVFVEIYKLTPLKHLWTIFGPL